MALTAAQAAKNALNDPAYQRLLDAQKVAKREEQARRAKLLGDYNSAYGQNLADLGWQTTSADPAMAGSVGSWDYSGQGTPSRAGQAFRSQLGGFSSRGAGRSTEFDRARTQLTEQFNRQKADLAGQQANFAGQQADWAGYNTEQRNARNQLLDKLAQNYVSGVTKANKRTAGMK